MVPLDANPICLPSTERAALIEACAFFKLSVGVEIGLLSGRMKLRLPEAYSWGRVLLHAKDFRVSKTHVELAPALFQHVATYVLAAQLDTFLMTFGKARFRHANEEVRSVSWVARLIRNAFAHDPFHPKWEVPREAANRVYEVANFLKLDTHGLDGRFVRREHYGGPLALLRLSELALQWTSAHSYE
jgi:hypothetical protein